MNITHRRATALVVAAMALLGVAQAVAAAPAARFDPREMKGKVAGSPTQILVLGTPHLVELKGDYKPEYLAPLLDRLATWKPDIITVEGLSGPECEMLARYKAIYPGVADDYCWDTDEALKATGLDVPTAEAKVDATLAAWPKTPSPAQRRQLASYFLAANDRPSATVQWMRLAPEEQHAGDGLSDGLVAILGKTTAGKNENYRTTVSMGADYETAIKAVWNQPNPFMQGYTAQEATIRDGDSLLAFYRYMNDPATNRAGILGDMGAAMQQVTPGYQGRAYVGWWEVRNLRMVANIRSSFVGHPGARVLSIVGATHKAYFETYLDMMSETRIVDAEAVLK